MSFGFSVGDFIAAIELTHKIRKDFKSAPSQFEAILDDELISESRSVGKRIKRVWKRFNWDPEVIDELRSRISTNISLLSAFNGRLTRDNVVKLLRYQENQESQAVLNWLTPIDYVSQQHAFISERQAGTGQWLLDSTEYQSWLESDKQTLFCPGIPGAGKTILTSIIVEELTSRFSNDPSIGIAYLYCSFRRQDEQKIDDLLASLLKQLAQSQLSLPGSIKDLYDRHKTRQARLSVDEISRSLQSVAALCSRVFIIIDALDECQVSHGCRAKFLLELLSLQTKGGVNLFVTLRSIPEISQKFQDSMSLEIRASEHDVRRYLDSHIVHLPLCIRRSPMLQEEIKTEIVKAVDGMFLLAWLHLKALDGKKSPKTVRTALKNLPSGSDAYDNAYEDAMIRIEGQGADKGELAKQVLSWIACAKRPLTTVEIQHALAIEVRELELDKDNVSEIEDMLSVCAGLVKVDKQSNVIRLVHYTTQEYFNRTQKRWFPDSEIEIAKACVTYFSSNAFNTGVCTTGEDFQARLEENALYDYATQYWEQYVRIASTVEEKLVLNFLESDAKVLAANQAMMRTGNGQELPRGMTALHFATYLGLEDVVVNSKDEHGRTPLSWAAENGSKAIVELLLTTDGVDVDLKDADRRSPLSHAAEHGHGEVVKALIKHHASAHTIDSCEDTPLIDAAWRGHEEVVKILLNQDNMPVNWRNHWGETALHKAADWGQENVVALLLGAVNVNPNRKDGGGDTPLLRAVLSDDTTIVRLLLNADNVLVNSENKRGRTPLIEAAARGRKIEIVKLLIARGASINASDKEFRTPLSHAAESGEVSIVKWLLAQAGIDVNSPDRSSRTPLSYAKQKGHDEIARSLEDADARVGIWDFFHNLGLK